ncbi:Histidine kinase [Algoriphagus ornithinivorans]|uniref:Histidine kinase n=1 Tax=Algoriphagus ornithinivorans TaxID=226506 RepID=A0A1I5I727_9BACT|nr:histidine kinase [Algoriphagus ornithinivorans]SFO56458.1 Histidine kinase [Algoriphagus ornithinivorans]
MFSKAFSSPSKANWVIQGAGVIWLLACILILLHYQVSFKIALTDAAVYTGLFMGAVLILDRVFSFYSPKGRNVILLLILPLFLSLIGAVIHRFGLQWFFQNEEEYYSFLQQHFYLRWAILALAEVMVTLLAIVVARLEQQEDSQKREIHMMELSREAELSQLRQQLQPHFLFNSLNSINALVVSQPQKARQMVLQLSDFLRGTIRKDLKAWLSLEEELSFLKLYLEIEKVRFGHRLQVEIDVPDEIFQMKIPQLLIQPLLENSIKHGLYGVTGEVMISLKAFKEQNYLILKLTNPFDPESPSPGGTGFGLSSVERRLYLLFGRNDLLEKSSENSLFSIQLKIPQLK